MVVDSPRTYHEVMHLLSRYFNSDNWFIHGDISLGIYDILISL